MPGTWEARNAMGKRSKSKKKGGEAKAKPSPDKKPWDRPAKPPLHGGFSGRGGRPQTNLPRGRGR